MLHVQFDPWPLLVTTVSGRLADADVVTLQDANTAALRRGGRIISLVDVTALTAVPTALQRQTYSVWRRASFEALRARLG